MPVPEKYRADFEEENIYHVFNRTNNNEKLFFTDENKRFFLQQFKTYLSAYLNVYCWCLLPTHFHFLVKIKPANEINSNIESKEFKLITATEKKFLNNQITLSELIEHAFKRFFQSYSLAFNKMHNRHGNLFYKSFKRIKIEKETHFTQAIIYIHNNPTNHGLVNDFTKYKWSSWQSLISESPTQLLRDEIYDWFGNKEQFIRAHLNWLQQHEGNSFSIED